MHHVPRRAQAGNGLPLYLVEDDIFVFVQPCSIIEGDGLFRRFNMTAGFIEPDWYRFKMDAAHLERAGGFRFCVIR
ncbi:hypothetical protein [Candidatus Nitrospira salsa]